MADYDRERKNYTSRKSLREDYAKTDKGIERGNASKVKYRDANTLKYKAHNAVNNAVRDKKLIKGSCEVCGDTETHGHHDDYSKPLDVRWLCNTHHNEWHNLNGEAING